MAQVLIGRDSRRPWVAVEAVCCTGIAFQGRAASCRWVVGWFVLITAMQWAFLAVTSHVMVALTECRASKVTMVPASSRGASSGQKYRVSFVFDPTST